MANNILEPFYLDLIQRETAHREQLRQQQLQQELQLTKNPPAKLSEPGPDPSPDAPVAIAPAYEPEGYADYAPENCEAENHRTVEPAFPKTTVGAGLRPAQPLRREPCSSPRRGEAFPSPSPKVAHDIRLNYHSPQCTICNHPEREDIDRAILHWHSPTAIAYEFDLPDRRIIYRHAHALGLFRLRAEQSRHALGFLIEQAQSIVPTADAIIRAVRALSCIDDHGHWHEPRKEVIITHCYEQVALPNNEGDSPDAPPRPPRIRRPPRAHRPQRRPESPSSQVEQTSRFLGGRSFSSDKTSAPSPGVSTPEVSEPPRTRGQVPSPLVSHSPLPSNWSRFKRANWSTRLLGKFRRKPNATNKTEKIGRHTFGMFGELRRFAFHRPDREAL